MFNRNSQYLGSKFPASVCFFRIGVSSQTERVTIRDWFPVNVVINVVINVINLVIKWLPIYVVLRPVLTNS